jgi:hypothetical protein
MAKSAHEGPFEPHTPPLQRNQRGQFLTGHKQASPGRPKGSRNKLGEQFISDLASSWEKHGAQALERCALEEPAQFVRVVASLLPREATLDIDVDVTMRAAIDAATAFRTLAALPQDKLLELHANEAGG